MAATTAEGDGMSMDTKAGGPAASNEGLVQRLVRAAEVDRVLPDRDELGSQRDAIDGGEITVLAGDRN